MSKDKKFDGINFKDINNWLIKRLREPFLERFGSLYLTPSEHREFRKNFCQGCGQKMKDPRIYFGQEFCGQCVSDWDPDGHYERAKKSGGRMWKIDGRTFMKKR